MENAEVMGVRRPHERVSTALPRSRLVARLASRLEVLARTPGAGPLAEEGGYPGWGGGLWLRMIFPWGLVAWLVPSGWTVSCQPSWCRTTWWCHQQ
jgi:hypothetical protein